MKRIKMKAHQDASNRELQNHQRQLHLPQPLRQTPLSKLPGIHQTLFGQVDALQVRCIRSRSATDAGGDQHWIGFQNDSIVDNLIDGQGDQVVVLDDCALVGCAPEERSKLAQSIYPYLT